ncbi:HAD-IA family hydrolase [Croceicoccus naphthovorans]|uniref:Haloacid dehalogenase n=1 Tax=Croceicoccus naphthovorans TaxID=1348774 RepID=A0A0G3XJL9_9SPHN|nr:HAD-IA family hydrolase [Croceicoccus naphthovorans]AKM10811.1 haloacid dehalogenase [Croceicoccus naphthovorans]MBB3989019.1 phosphoglycolate phosphatase [Croceicoccus naphthovorans]
MGRLAIFDCDGTLVDGQASVCIAMEDAFAASKLEAPPRAIIRRAVGLSLPQAMAMLLPDSTSEQQEMLAERYRLAFRAQREAGLVHEPLFDGMKDLLLHLRDTGWTLAVATGKSDRGLNHCLALHGITDLFASLQTADRHPSKPDPAMIEQILFDTGMSADDGVMIGDTMFDIAMARNARMPSIGVEWGYHERAELLESGARAVATDMAELRALLEGL